MEEEYGKSEAKIVNIAAYIFDDGEIIVKINYLFGEWAFKNTSN